MFDVAQNAPSILEDYMRMSKDATKTITPLVLAVAMELRRLHGTALAAGYLQDLGVAMDVILELMCDEHTLAIGLRKANLPHPQEANSSQR